MNYKSNVALCQKTSQLHASSQSQAASRNSLRHRQCRRLTLHRPNRKLTRRRDNLGQTWKSNGSRTKRMRIKP
jgi:hypothetical protein